MSADPNGFYWPPTESEKKMKILKKYGPIALGITTLIGGILWGRKAYASTTTSTNTPDPPTPPTPPTPPAPFAPPTPPTPPAPSQTKKVKQIKITPDTVSALNPLHPEFQTTLLKIMAEAGQKDADVLTLDTDGTERILFRIRDKKPIFPLT